MNKIFTIPNLITSTRIVGAVCLFFTESFSTSFFVIYTLCGLSDAIDGWVARTMKSTSEFGAKLDSVADLLFYSMMAMHIFPILLEELPLVLWCVAAGVISLRVIIYLMVAVCHHQLASLHTYLNKMTSLIIFTMPYLIVQIGATAICTVLGVVSSVATVEEFLIHTCSKTYQTDVRTIFQLKKRVDVGVS